VKLKFEPVRPPVGGRQVLVFSWSAVAVRPCFGICSRRLSGLGLGRSPLLRNSRCISRPPLKRLSACGRFDSDAVRRMPAPTQIEATKSASSPGPSTRWRIAWSRLRQSERRLLLDLSHELRSPLTRMKRRDRARSGRKQRLDHARSYPEGSGSPKRAHHGAPRSDSCRKRSGHRRMEPVALDRMIRGIAEDSNIEAKARGSEVSVGVLESRDHRWRSRAAAPRSRKRGPECGPLRSGRKPRIGSWRFAARLWCPNPGKGLTARGYRGRPTASL